MASRQPIARPSARADRPRTWTLVATGVLAASLGLVLVRGTMSSTGPRDAAADGAAPPSARGDRAEGRGAGAAETDGGAAIGRGGAETATEADAGSEAKAESEAATETGTEGEAATETGTEGEAATETGTEDETGTQAQAESGTEPAAGTAAETAQGSGPAPSVTPTGVAYLRCDGVPKQDGPIPCPRDEQMEQRVWDVLEAELPACGTPPGTGRADLRVHVRPGQPNELRLHEGRTELDGPRLLACLSGPLAEIETDLDPELLIVSFRFELD